MPKKGAKLGASSLEDMVPVFEAVLGAGVGEEEVGWVGC
jgi:hypothetical protein